MPYESTIQFTFDVICPWTYLAKKRLDQALAHYAAQSPHAPDTRFTYHFAPYQLDPAAPAAGEDKRAWYTRTKYADDAARYAAYARLMAAHGASAGIAFRFDGLVANTLPAHRVVQALQEARGADAADAALMELYARYHEQEQHPASAETLRAAALAAGLAEPEARALADDEDEGLMETKLAIREVVGNGVDSVPEVRIEGKKRDITLTGAKEVDEYVRELERVAKENAS